MKFKYTALGANNQKLEGVLEADSLDAAREQLHKMNLAVIAINELTTEEEAAAEQVTMLRKSKEGIKTFYFTALDPQKKEVNGTIDSKEPSSAFRRLIMEYQFNVIDLYPDGSPDPEAESFKPEFKEWRAMMEEEGQSVKKQATASDKNELEESEKVSEEIVAEMDGFIVNTKSILKDFRAQYSDAMLKEIERVLGELERIRSSNNLKHITKLCNELYELASYPDAAQEENPDDKYKEAVSKLGKSGFIANSFQLLKAHSLQKRLTRFSKITAVFGKIQMAIRGKKGGETTDRLEQRMRSRRARWFTHLTRSLKGETGEDYPTLIKVISKFLSFISAPSTILRRARKQEMNRAFRDWQRYRKEAPLRKAKEAKAGEIAAVEPEIGEELPALPKKDYSPFFAEIDSFVGWLLFFYISYFYLTSFSIERNIGLPKALVAKTLTSPLILNISIFLVVAHLALTLKIKFFRTNFLGSLFLFFLSFGLFTLLIINF